MAKMNDVMIDLEAMDTLPTAAIVSIGAVMFGADGLGDTFYAVVDLGSSVEHGLTMSTSTIKWWLSQLNKTDTFDENKSDLLPQVLLDFAKWLANDSRVWGNGADFDNAILANAYNMCDIPKPWKCYDNMCYRTIKNLAKDVKIERVGSHHNALDDAKSQALHLIRVLERLGIQL